MREPELQRWITMKPEEKLRYPLTDEIASTIDRFYFNHYCQCFRRGAFARANSSMCVLPVDLINSVPIQYTILFRPMMNMCGMFLEYDSDQIHWFLPFMQDDHGEFLLKFLSGRSSDRASEMTDIASILYLLSEQLTKNDFTRLTDLAAVGLLSPLLNLCY